MPSSKEGHAYQQSVNTRYGTSNATPNSSDENGDTLSQDVAAGHLK